MEGNIKVSSQQEERPPPVEEDIGDNYLPSNRHSLEREKSRCSQAQRFADRNSIVEELFQRVLQLEAQQGARSQNNVCGDRTPFTREVELESLPPRFKVPTMQQYNGDSNPYDHLDAFNV